MSMRRDVRAYFGARFALFALAWLATAAACAAGELVWETRDGFRSAALSVPASDQAGFALLEPSETGIAFSNRLADETVAKNRLYEIGSGVALGDVDGDGRVDIYFCRLEGDNVLYRNLGDSRKSRPTPASPAQINSQPVALSPISTATAIWICW
jgi:hypothetical protein